VAEHEEGIWGRDAGELGRKLSYPTAPAPLPTRTGSEWGLASLLTAGVCLIVCPTTLLVWASIIAVHDQRWTKTDVRDMCLALIGCEFLVFGLVATALAFGIVGVTAARKHQTPVALPLTGLIVSAVTLVCWIVILVSSVSTMGGLLPPR
jgi:hypothetical protein